MNPTTLKCARALITRDDGKILLARRSPQTALAGKWELAGGKVDPGETFRQAAVREVAEELGLCISLIERLVEDNDFWRDAPIKTKVYLAKAHTADKITLNPREHDRYEWFSFYNLPDTAEMTGSAELAVGVYRTHRNLHNILD